MTTDSVIQAKKAVFDALCEKGKKCGDICIPKKSTCHKEGSTAQVSGKRTGFSLPVVGLASSGLTLGTAAIAGGSAVIIASKLKKEYIEGFSVSGEIAKKQAENIKAPKLNKSVNTAIFTVGGFGTKDAFSESKQLKTNIESLKVSGLHIEPIEYSEFNNIIVQK